jgi:hypothetical protein
VEGLVLLAGGGTAFEVGYPLPPPDLVALGGVGLAAGLAVVAVGFALHEAPEPRRGAGSVLVGLAVVGLAGGGGFLLGSGLVIAGGLLVIFGRTPPILSAHR